MLDTAAHMLLLLQQAKIKNERPQDASFLPLSLSMACLLRQLPAGLAPPAGGLSFHQLDRLPQSVLEQKLAGLMLDDPLRAFSFVCALVRYTKTSRALLTVCHDHLINRKTVVEATQSVVQIVVDALASPPSRDEDDEPTDDEQEPVKAPSATAQETKTTAAALAVQTQGAPDEKPMSAAATDPSGIMRRAVGRDVGDGSSVLEIMKKFTADPRIQSHGVRALKGVVRSATISAETATDLRSASPSSPEREEDDEGLQQGEAYRDTQQRESSMRAAVQVVIDRMKRFPSVLALQRDGLLCLAEYAHQADEHVATITSNGGIISIVDAMAALPDDVPANMAGLSVLAHPKIADESIVRVNPESRRLVLSAMERFPLNEQVQGLSCLALANLSLRQDASMQEIVAKGGLEVVVSSMKRFASTGLVQAAGCWLIAIISAKNEDMRMACMEAGALPVCEKARLRFPADLKVQQHAVQAIQTMLPGESIEPEEPTTCALQ